MSLYFFLRYGLVSVLLIGWVFHQMFIKKRKWVDLQGDAMAVVIFVGVWMGLAYAFSH